MASVATPTQKGQSYPVRRVRKSMRPDHVHPRDFRQLVLRGPMSGGAFFCEACSYFKPEGNLCALGYKTQHLESLQTEMFERTGTMTFCRAIEID